MKNKTGIIIGFVIGLASFLWLLKNILPDHIPPEDEVPPPFVILAALISGLVLALAGYWVQNSLDNRETGAH